MFHLDSILHKKHLCNIHMCIHIYIYIINLTNEIWVNNLIFHHISPSWTHFTGRFPILCSALLFRVFRSFGSFRYQMQQLQRSNSLDHAGSVTWKVVPCIWPAQILYYIYGLILSYITWQANSSKPMQVTSIGHQRFSGFGHGMSWSSIWRVNHFSSSPSPNVHCYPNPGSCQCDL